MVSLRELRREDAPLMLEWMHDSDTTKGLKKDLSSCTLEDAETFCESMRIPDEIKTGMGIHFAITDENDEYLGTISLKNIDLVNSNAEYAIILRKNYQGHGIASRATHLILEYAFDKLNLHRVYLSVLADNDNAVKLYEKCGFKYEGEFRGHIRLRDKYINWKWYGVLRDEFDR